MINATTLSQDGTGALACIRRGNFSSITANQAGRITRTNTALLRWYADDAGVVLTGAGSVPDIRNGLYRTLLTKDNTGGDIRVHGLMGQIKAYDAKWNDEVVSAVHGRIELVRSASTMTLGGNGITAAVLGVPSVSGAVTVNTNHFLAGVAAVSDFRATLTQTGTVAAFLAAAYDTTNWSDGTARTTWGYGLYIAPSAAATGVYIGTATTGISIAGATTTGISIGGASTTGISITGAATDGIKILTGAMTDGIEIASACTNGVNVSGTTTTGVLVAGAAATGVYVSGACSATCFAAGAAGTITDGAVIRLGVSATPIVYDGAGTGFVVGYFDSGATSGWPCGAFISTNVTAAGGAFTALQGDAVLTAAKSTVTGIENWMQVNTGGRVTGACRSVQGTIDFSNEDKGSGGVYSGACLNIKGEGSACDIGTTQRVSCLELKTEGTFSSNAGENFQTKAAGYFIYLNGFTAGAGSILNNTTLTWTDALASVIGMRVGVGADGASGDVYYVPLIPAAEWN